MEIRRLKQANNQEGPAKYTSNNCASGFVLIIIWLIGCTPPKHRELSIEVYT